MATALPLPTSGNGSAFGKTALVFAGLTIVVPIVSMLLFAAKADAVPDQQGWGWLASLAVLAVGAFVSVIAAGLTSLAGSVAGGLSLARGEAGTWRALVGLLVNVPVLLFVAFLFVVIGMNNGG